MNCETTTTSRVRVHVKVRPLLSKLGEGAATTGTASSDEEVLMSAHHRGGSSDEVGVSLHSRRAVDVHEGSGTVTVHHPRPSPLSTPSAPNPSLRQTTSSRHLIPAHRLPPPVTITRASSSRSITSHPSRHQVLPGSGKPRDTCSGHSASSVPPGQGLVASATTATTLTSQFSFDAVYGPDSTHDDIFDGTLLDVLDASLSGAGEKLTNACLMCYGPTGAGKTYSMVGEWGAVSAGNSLTSKRVLAENQHLGLLPRAIFAILEHTAAGELRTGSAAAGGQPPSKQLYLSGLEVYMDEVRDLLTSSPSSSLSSSSAIASALRPGVSGASSSVLHLRDTVNYEDMIASGALSSHHVRSMEDAARLYDRIVRNRVTASHACNDQSSRSHAIFLLRIVEQRHSTTAASTATNNNGRKLPRSSTSSSNFLALVDLAGSERIKESGVTGIAAKEAQFINKSLSALASVVYALHHNSSSTTGSAGSGRSSGRVSSSTAAASGGGHVPYRDSCLTRLLRPCFEGGHITTVVHVPPSAAASEHACTTLKFATRMKEVSLLHKKESASASDAMAAELMAMEARVAERQRTLWELCAEMRVCNVATGSVPRRAQRLIERQQKQVKLESAQQRDEEQPRGVQDDEGIVAHDGDGAETTWAKLLRVYKAESQVQHSRDTQTQLTAQIVLAATRPAATRIAALTRAVQEIEKTVACAKEQLMVTQQALADNSHSVINGLRAEIARKRKHKAVLFETLGVLATRISKIERLSASLDAIALDVIGGLEADGHDVGAGESENKPRTSRRKSTAWEDEAKKGISEARSLLADGRQAYNVEGRVFVSIAEHQRLLTKVCVAALERCKFFSLLTAQNGGKKTADDVWSCARGVNGAAVDSSYWPQPFVFSDGSSAFHAPPTLAGCYHLTKNHSDDDPRYTKSNISARGSTVLYRAALEALEVGVACGRRIVTDQGEAVSATTLLQLSDDHSKLSILNCAAGRGGGERRGRGGGAADTDAEEVDHVIDLCDPSLAISLLIGASNTLNAVNLTINTTNADHAYAREAALVPPDDVAGSSTPATQRMPATTGSVGSGSTSRRTPPAVLSPPPPTERPLFTDNHRFSPATPSSGSVAATGHVQQSRSTAGALRSVSADEQQSRRRRLVLPLEFSGAEDVEVLVFALQALLPSDDGALPPAGRSRAQQQPQRLRVRLSQLPPAQFCSIAARTAKAVLATATAEAANQSQQRQERATDDSCGWRSYFGVAHVRQLCNPLDVNVFRLAALWSDVKLIATSELANIRRRKQPVVVKSGATAAGAAPNGSELAELCFEDPPPGCFVLSP